jgi:exonuclease III
MANMRIIFWNIRAGGGRRASWIVDQLCRWQPDIIAFSEFRGTDASQALALALAAHGWQFQLSAADPQKPPANAVFLAARTALVQVHLRTCKPESTRWLLARHQATGLVVGSLHAPNYVTGRKRPFFDAVMAFCKRWRTTPAIIGGDTNCGVPPLDGNPATFHPWETAWIPELRNAGWLDVYREFEPEQPAYTWYSPNAGNGYRLDQAFINRAARSTVMHARHAWGTHHDAPDRRDALSDHAALLVELDLNHL